MTTQRPARRPEQRPEQEPPRQPATRPGRVELEEPGAALAPLFHLVLLDDDDHTYDYVIEMLGSIFGYGREKAYALASIVDGEGRVVVETAGHDQVTRHQRKIHSHGADPRVERCKGSMSAIVEEASAPSAG